MVETLQPINAANSERPENSTAATYIQAETVTQSVEKIEYLKDVLEDTRFIEVLERVQDMNDDELVIALTDDLLETYGKMDTPPTTIEQLYEANGSTDSEHLVGNAQDYLSARIAGVRGLQQLLETKEDPALASTLRVQAHKLARVLVALERLNSTTIVDNEPNSMAA